MRITRTLQKTPPLPAETNIYKSAVIEAPKKITIQETALPVPGEGEVRIKLEGCGVCASNIPVWEGREWFKYPIPAGQPGHEGWGVIDAIGKNVKGFTEGQKVTGLTYHAYATHDIGKAEHIVKLPDFFDDKPFPGEPLGCAMNIFKRSQVTKDHTITIVGCELIGLLLIQLSKSAGAKVIAVSQNEFSLETAKSAGADYTIHLDDQFKVIEKVKEITHNNLCDRVIETTGKEWILNLSIELTAIRGKFIVGGFHQDGMRTINTLMCIGRGIDMISAHERDPKQYVRGIKDAILAIETQAMYPFPFFTHLFPLEQIEKAFKQATERPKGFVKALIINI